MRLHILSAREAKGFVPEDPTLVIRCRSPGEREIYPLRDSDLFKVRVYYFADIDITFGGRADADNVFNDEIARELLRNFYEDRTLPHKSGDHYGALLVHCREGFHRSPAVAIALNTCFDLGYNFRSLMREYPQYNRHVYETLLRCFQGGGLVND